ncbi:dihydrofolate reductase family protein [Kribbella solani]|nr:dihydrofolate reductase family protein [Kribbella solani]MDX3005543.1 dihydrofolate reductase family protein [Kribbella solani]
MRKLIYWVHSSIDGYIDGPNGEFDWPVMGPELIAYSDALDRRVDTLLFGRPVWEMMVGFWPKAESVRDDPHTAAFAPFWRATPKIVFSHDYPGDEWTSQVIGGDLAEQVTELKSRPGQDLLLTGGSALAATLADLGLIDEFHIAVHPLTLGAGRPLLPPTNTRRPLHHITTTLADAQIVITHYQPTPPPTTDPTT